MAFNINTFITSMFRDGARPNLFDITFGVPTGIAGFTAPNVTLRAKATTLPSASIGVATAYYFGRQAKFAGNKVFGDWTVSILMDELDFAPGGSRAFLEAWSNGLSGHVLNTRQQNMVIPNNYMMDGIVKQYAKDGTMIIGEYHMIGCFPTDVGAIPLDWEANDRIMEFQVTFAMQWWERAGITDVSGGI